MNGGEENPTLPVLNAMKPYPLVSESPLHLGYRVATGRRLRSSIYVQADAATLYCVRSAAARK